MGIRRGFVVGFLVGTCAAALLSKARRAEAPSEAPPATMEPETPRPPAEAEEVAGRAPVLLKETLEQVKRRAEEAVDAAHEAQQEKEAELRRQFDDLRRKR